MDKKIVLNELEYVEEPFLRQLERQGWRILRAGEEGKFDPAVTYRGGFNELVIEKILKKSLLKINPWLEGDQIQSIISEILLPNVVGGVLENNKFILEKLVEHTAAENRKTGRTESVQFIDYKILKNNDFLAISQYKVNIPGTEHHIIPDIVLFINGIPLVVIECKSAYLPDPIGEAVTQLMRYQNKRGEDKEGNEKLFWYNQIVIATSKQICRYSSITGEFENFIEWKDTYPYKLSDIDTEGSESVTSQHVLIQGLLNKRTLLDIIQSFIIFQESSEGKIIKIVPRYQQYRTVSKILERLLSEKKPNDKGGIVWHTQGSGKSLTMMMTVRKMYREPDLAGYKTVFITDRVDLERQLKATAKSLGYTVNIAKNIPALKRHLKTNTPDLVMGMIHKFQERELEHEFPVLNTSEKILVMIDEAHRSQYKFLGANLAKSLPNSVKIAFTGTPIDKTETTFGEYIDKYSIRTSVQDGVTVEIIYEGRTHRAEISDREQLNKRFEDVFDTVDDETRKDILGRYTWRGYLEAEETIKEKAEDMLKHYLAHILPNGFKAQVVSVSRIAAIRYKKAFDELLNNKDWIDNYISEVRTKINIDKDILKRLKVGVVISGRQNDEPEMREYTDETKHERIIQCFKTPFDNRSKENKDGDIGIIVVQSMLLTGFDAPIEQVMYLDDKIRDHNLLQAIARVNRVEKNKHAGFVIDYVGIVNHLRNALAKFDKKDVDEILQVIKDESKDMDELVFSKSETEDFFNKFDIDVNDIDACVDLLADEEIRDDFLNLFRKFTVAMDKALPKPEALKFIQNLKQFSFISQVARNRYRDEKFSIKNTSKKIRDIVDEYLISKGVDPKIPPIPIFSEKFKAKMNKEKSSRAKAEGFKVAIREHLYKHSPEDPELYERFSDKLEKILKEYKDNWDILAKELEKLLDEIKEGREAEENFGFDRKTEMPFFGLMKREIYGTKKVQEINQDKMDSLVQVTKDILERLKNDIQIVDFWNNIPEQRKLKGYIASHLLTSFKKNTDIFNKRKVLSQKIMELAFHIYQA